MLVEVGEQLELGRGQVERLPAQREGHRPLVIAQAVRRHKGRGRQSAAAPPAPQPDLIVVRKQVRSLDAVAIPERAVGAASVVQHVVQAVALDPRAQPRHDVAPYNDLADRRAPDRADVGLQCIAGRLHILVQRDQAARLGKQLFIGCHARDVLARVAVGKRSRNRAGLGTC